MAKAVRQLKGSGPSKPSDDSAAHERVGFDQGLQFADETVSWAITHGTVPHSFVSTLIERVRGNNAVAAEAFLYALVVLIAKTSHSCIAAVREAQALERRSNMLLMLANLALVGLS